MKTQKLDLNEAVFNDLDGNPVQWTDGAVCKAFGNAIFVNNPTIEIENISRAIHSGNEVEVTKNDLLILIHVNDKLAGYSRFMKNGINEYLTNKLEILNKE